jgi:hypothetical protein
MQLAAAVAADRDEVAESSTFAAKCSQLARMIWSTISARARTRVSIGSLR